MSQTDGKCCGESQSEWSAPEDNRMSTIKGSQSLSVTVYINLLPVNKLVRVLASSLLDSSYITGRKALLDSRNKKLCLM